MTNLLERVAPHVAIRLRAYKNRNELYGLFAPPSLLLAHIPQGSVAVDVGAAYGLYAHFFSKRAHVVHAFEANPAVYERLRRSARQNIETYNLAISDRSGTISLSVPRNLGEASVELQYEDGAPVTVQAARLDDLGIEGTGFLKIDVEGHELAVLAGAEQLIAEWRPTVFLEAEERHRSGAVASVVQWFEERGYSGQFLSNGIFHPMSEFRLEADQLRLQNTPTAAAYACNFLFKPKAASRGAL